ncbi:IS5 family transposase [Actinomadura craniellae]|uniref:IS5 family transposase n=1 Tax=Actinomadura craniellae TaxID=2231787 RepID=A0A365H7L7_9ACTN|nr:IS5 family transposase [Actinomadura craniellae]RAY15018.1 IS5 family transposase [Actinomadura craniellae]
MSDARWQLIKPVLATWRARHQAAAPGFGRRPEHDLRAVMNAIVYVDRTGIAWRYLPHDYPPWQTVYWHFVRWEEQGVTRRMLEVLRRRLYQELHREHDPSAAVMGSQSVKGANAVGSATRSYDNDKKINGRKRFVLTDTLAPLLAVMVRPAGVQDRDGATAMLLGLHPMRRCRMVFVGTGFTGRLVTWASKVLGIVVHIVGKPPGQRGFQVHPRQWVVEHTLAWLLIRRRLARDHERHPETTEALIR